MDAIQALSTSQLFFSLCGNWQTYPKIHMKMQGHGIAKQAWKGRTSVENSHFPVSKLTKRLQ